MKKNLAITLGVSAILCFLLSLAMTWLTIDHARREFDIGTITVTGLSGSITLWVQCPVWVIVIVSLIGVVLALLNQLKIVLLPKVIVLGPLLFSSLFLCKALLIALSRNGNFGMGFFFAVIGLLIGCCLAFSNNGQRTIDDLMQETFYEDSEK